MIQWKMLLKYLKDTPALSEVTKRDLREIIFLFTESDITLVIKNIDSIKAN